MLTRSRQPDILASQLEELIDVPSDTIISRAGEKIYPLEGLYPLRVLHCMQSRWKLDIRIISPAM